MTSFLARLASYPRQRFVEDGHNLDIAFVTSQIWVMSHPAVTWPERLYRNDLHHVKRLLDERAGKRYRVFDFRAEGPGYADADFDGRVEHFPFVDHQPPPFALLPRIVAGMEAHLNSEPGAVAVIHCKAGKGRSGLATCGYLLARGGMTESEARTLFTEKRMRVGFGEGLSIPSQRRYLRYLEQWHRAGESTYRPQKVRIDSVVVRGLRNGCRLTLRRFEEGGARITTAHTFSDAETGQAEGDSSVTVLTAVGGLEVEDDVCVYLSRGNAFAHFWFNTVLETERRPGEHSFEIEWEEVDGWKGTRWRGSKAYDSVKVHWTVLDRA